MTKSANFSAEFSNLESIRQFVEQAAGSGDPKAIAEMVLAVDEAVTNIIQHGYQGKPGAIEIGVRYKGKDLHVVIRDKAAFFDPRSVPAPDLTLPLSERKPGGLGIFLMRKLTNNINFRRTPDGRNELELIREGVHN